jgi:hypothetical protein
MADRDWQDRGGPGEMESGGVSPVVGDIERSTTAPPPPDPPPAGPGGRELADTAVQTLRGMNYPLARDDLEREAAGRGAPAELLDLLARLPDRVYGSAEDVAGELRRAR